MPSPPKTRINKPTHNQRYPLGEIPEDIITAIGRQIIHRLAIGRDDIGGDDFGDIFAEAVGGEHANIPEGLADVSWNGCAWSVKTVKTNAPFTAPHVRLISGRNSPAYSKGIHNPFEDLKETGAAVLEIWNERVKQARHEYSGSLRIFVMIRSMERLEFTLFEEEAELFVPRNYEWTLNKNNNLEGHAGDQHLFTWQPHGGQFTILRNVPASAVHFKLKRPQIISSQCVLDKIGYRNDWVTIIKPPHNQKDKA